MKDRSTRREFLRTLTAASAGLAFSSPLLPSREKSVLVFTKSSGWEHDVVKRTNGKPSIFERAVTRLGDQHGFSVTATKDGRIFDSKDLRAHVAVLFFTTGNLTELGTDGNPPMTPKGKQALLDSVFHGLGFVGVHSASDTFHTLPDPPDRSNRYITHGEKSDPYIRMLGGELITHSDDPEYQEGELVVIDPRFPGLEGAISPIKFTEEWYSLKDFAPDLHVILTLNTSRLVGDCYHRPPYPVTWARQHGAGRVFYAAMGDREETWENAFFLTMLAGGIRWAIRDVDAQIPGNIKTASPGYSELPSKPHS